MHFWMQTYLLYRLQTLLMEKLRNSDCSPLCRGTATFAVSPLCRKQFTLVGVPSANLTGFCGPKSI